MEENKIITCESSSNTVSSNTVSSNTVSNDLSSGNSSFNETIIDHFVNDESGIDTVSEIVDNNLNQSSIFSSIILPENNNTEEDDVYQPIIAQYDTLVLSGGSFKGIALLGALQCILDNKLYSHITNIVGTSSGSMIAYLLCIGYTPLEIMSYLCTRLFLDNLPINLGGIIKGKGVISYDIIQDHLEKLTLEKIGYIPTFNDIKTKFGKSLYIITYNYTKGLREILSPKTTPDLKCLIAIRMSSNLPMIFDHYQYEESYYVDGGIVDNFAIDIGEQIGEKIIGILLDYQKVKNNGSDLPENTLKKINTGVNNFLEYTYKLFMIPIKDSIERKIEKTSKTKTSIIRISIEGNLFTIPHLNKHKLLLFDSGYREAQTFLLDI